MPQRAQVAEFIGNKVEENIEILRLSEAPEFINKVIKLIELEFNYSEENSAQKDFFPLLREENFHNNFILINKDKELIGHIGTKPCLYKVINNDYPVLHLGGIAIAKKFQGQGHFRQLFEYVLNLLASRHAFLFLWSDKQDLYSKFDFFPVGGQILAQEHYKPIEGYVKTSFTKLNAQEIKDIQEIYQLNSMAFFKPRRDDWEEILNTSSVNIHLKKEGGQVISYYMEGKGQDLNNIIHEFGIHPDHYDTELPKFQDNASFIPFQFYPLDQDFFELQYTALCRLGNPFFIPNFIEDFSNQDIKNFERKDGKVTFIFDNRDYECGDVELFEMLWGPQIVKEFYGRYQGLYIPGIESI